MLLRRPALANLLFILVGGVVAGTWIYLAGGSGFVAQFSRVDRWFLLPLLATTAFYLLARFLRWQFLLRQFGIRLPIRASLSLYLASLLGIATPGYLGEVILRCVLLRNRFGVSMRTTALIFVAERFFDAVALISLALLTARTGWVAGLLALLLAAVIVAGLVGRFLAHRTGISLGAISSLYKGHVLIRVLFVSVVAWGAAAQLVFLAAAGLRLWVNPLVGIHIYSVATLLGGVTLSPAGVGATGSFAILQLQSLPLSLSDSVLIISLVRIVSTGLSLVVSAVCLLREWSRGKAPATPQPLLHFDEIAGEYRAQFQEHVWKHLLKKKTALITQAISEWSATQGGGLDLGCGLGDQCLELTRQGYGVIGADVAIALLRPAHEKGASVVNASAETLPLASNSLRFVYAIGVLHHLPNGPFRQSVCAEVLRVLKPGGLFIVQETNTRNPLFRFYMGYIFPLLRSIDEGTEAWLEPETWQSISGSQLVDLKHFTFMPDFMPALFMSAFKPLEDRLEQSAIKSLSVHYMAVVRKDSCSEDDQHNQ